MEEIDTLTYHVRRVAPGQEKVDEQFLITPERIQKLDLLMHLLANLTQALVVCGPEGIGKTTLLKVLQERKVSSWSYCLVQGNSELSFEKILGLIAGGINEGMHKSDRPLSALLEQYESRNKKIILMIDDAGVLVPGLITALIQYAAANPVLRLILVLTHDDLYLKNGTDRVIEECHFVEIPPLSEKQCGVFLQNLAAKPFAKIAFNSINETFIEKIYRETHGIPGRIIADLPDNASSRQGQNPTLMLVLAVTALIAIAFFIQWFSASNKESAEKPAIKSVQKSTKLEPATSQPKLTQTLKNEPVLLNEQFDQLNNAAILSEQQTPNETFLEQNQAEKVNKDTVAIEPADGLNGDLKTEIKPLQPARQEVIIPAKSQIEISPSTAPALVQQPETKESENALVSDEERLQSGAAEDEGSDWVRNQPAESFTLQVMVLSKEQAIKDIIKQQRAQGRTVRYIKTVSPNGSAKYLLLYGSYASSNLANKAKQSLPLEFRQSYARKFGSIKNQAGSIR